MTRNTNNLTSRHMIRFIFLINAYNRMNVKNLIIIVFCLLPNVDTYLRSQEEFVAFVVCLFLLLTL